MNILQLLAGIFTGKAGESIGSAVSTAAQIGAVLATLAPLAIWLTGHKDDVFLTLTYGDLAFWGAVLAAQLLLVIRLVHRAPPPG